MSGQRACVAVWIVVASHPFADDSTWTVRALTGDNYSATAASWGATEN